MKAAADMAPALAVDRSRPRSLWSDAWARLLKNRAAVFGGVLVIVLILAALTAPLIAPFDPIKQDLRSSLQPPSPTHFFGTDVHGRDIFSRVLHGAAISLRIGALGTLIGATIGITLGLISGFYGGLTDTLIMRVMDVLLAFPGLLLAIAIVAAIGPGLENVIIAVGVFSMPEFARLVRGSILSAKQQDSCWRRRRGAGCAPHDAAPVH